MILEEFISKISGRMPDGSWSLTSWGVTFPAASVHFGDIEVAAGNDELIVQFGNFTHGHFSSADAAVSFLMDVLDGRVEFYGSSNRGGGHCPRGQRSLLSKLLFGKDSYVWPGTGG